MIKVPKVILLIETSREYGRNLLRGIASYSYLHGPWTMERETPFYIKSDHRKKTSTDPSQWLADGIIMREPQNVEEILAKNIPTIFASYLNEHITGTSRIITDDAAIGRMGVEHFRERGFRYYAYMGFDDMYWSRNRCVSFQKNVLETDGQVHVFQQPKNKNERLWINEQFLVADWLKSLPKPLGLMACNDDRGQQVLAACRLADLKVPDEVAVLGVDNDEFVCNLSNPPLSSIALNTEKAGFQAAQLLDKLMAREKIPPQKINVSPTHVETRQSSDVLAIEDREVADAVRFIREHARQLIQVEDVADAVALSRRILYDRFQKILGCSVHEEIARIRVEQICRMLESTQISMLQIARSLGYDSDKHLARYFRRQKGISPLEYRKRYGYAKW